MLLAIILHAFDLDPKAFSIEQINTGYINATYKLKGKSNSYILQRINKNVFTKPEVIASNLRAAADFLKNNYPDYRFLSSVKTKGGDEMVYDTDGFPWRLFPFIENSITIDKVETAEEAFSAASEFAKLTCYLAGADIHRFNPTIERFHDLHWRYEQFETALKAATSIRLEEAADAIEACVVHKKLVDQYIDLVGTGALQLRVMHNDSKINNILFDASTRKAVCVIDLDTLMPGYFIYDVGDMIRTFVSPVNEEERDLDKIIFRKDIYEALLAGYQSQISDTLNEAEKRLFPFAGMMMTYIMALRMLTDFLQGNVYYQITYADQNLVRARNQLRLLEILSTEYHRK